jgi:hypothetical protein
MKRIYHIWSEWECYPSGFYNDKTDSDLSKEELEQKYADFLADREAFWTALNMVIKKWKNSCEHYLSNENMNRIAWLGQASACLALNLPSAYRGGFHLLTPEKQKEADLLALDALNLWLKNHNEPPLTYEQAQSKTEANLY